MKSGDLFIAKRHLWCDSVKISKKDVCVFLDGVCTFYEKLEHQKYVVTALVSPDIITHLLFLDDRNAGLDAEDVFLSVVTVVE